MLHRENPRGVGRPCQEDATTEPPAVASAGRHRPAENRRWAKPCWSWTARVCCARRSSRRCATAVTGCWRRPELWRPSDWPALNPTFGSWSRIFPRRKSRDSNSHGGSGRDFLKRKSSSLPAHCGNCSAELTNMISLVFWSSPLAATNCGRWRDAWRPVHEPRRRPSDDPPRRVPRCPRPLEIISSQPPCHIHHFPDEIQTRRPPRLHRLR
jgi:hypothetical protein